MRGHSAKIGARRLFCVLSVSVAGSPVLVGHAQEASPLPASSYVRPIDSAGLAQRFEALPKRDRALVDMYMEGAERYVLTVADGVFPNRGTEHWRNIMERAHGAAVLSSLPSKWPAALKQRCRRESVAFVREFVNGFAADPLFGNRWQGSWWAAEMGMAAWFLWHELEPALQRGTAEMIVFHADRVAGQKPGARVKGNTEAETVAWNSTILALATNMMPDHPNNATWLEASKHYVYTIFATSGDVTDTTPGADGRAVKDWVAGANVHDDFALENHNRFHIGYIFACYRFIINGAAMYRLAGKPAPAAFRHHTSDVYRNILLQCLNGSGFAVYVSDNDWKRYHVWTESAAVHGYLALTESSPLASALEERALTTATSCWRDFPDGFEYANPYVCGKAWTPRIADIVLLHLLSPPAPEPMPSARTDAALRGVRRKDSINLLSHYSAEGSFRSFFWGPGPTVRHIEAKTNGWMLLPLATNYGLCLDGKRSSDKGATVSSGKGRDWFWTLRRSPRGDREAFVSLPAETVVMMVDTSGPAVEKARQADTMVNIEKPHTEFTIFFQGGRAVWRHGRAEWDRTDGVGGRTLETTWVNLADSIGYVVADLSQGRSTMVLPRPGRRSSLGLYHVENPGSDRRFVMVAFPNRDHTQTEAAASGVIAAFSGGVITCLVERYFVWANFSDQEQVLQAPSGIQGGTQLRCAANSVGILRLGGRGENWVPVK